MCRVARCEAGNAFAQGDVREEIKQVAPEECAEMVVLGRPAGGESAFQLAKLQAFAEEIEAKTGRK